MPLQRRLPKSGFYSRMSIEYGEVRLHELARVDSSPIDLDALKRAGIVAEAVTKAKVIKSGTIAKPVHLKGIRVTKGAREVIEQAGGQVEA